jgi:Flp pilus assembly protein CpaB
MLWNKTAKTNGSKVATVTLEDGRVVTYAQAVAERNEDALAMFGVWAPTTVVEFEKKEVKRG